jgi:hypothetical protein
MSKGSKRILRDKSKSLNKSNSQSSFLQRNYYNPHERSKLKGELSIQNMQRRQANRDRSAKALVRDMSGSKISFLNSSGGLGPQERLFSPAIN